MPTTFRIKPANHFIWNLPELIDFLSQSRGQDIIITNGTEGCCAENIGLYRYLDKFDLGNVVVETSNVLETHQTYYVAHVLPWKFLDISQPVESEYHTWNLRSIFGTLYGRPLWHRIGIASHLMVHHGDKSAVGFVADPNDVDSRSLFEIDQLWLADPRSLKNFTQCQSMFPLQIQDIDPYSPGLTLSDGFISQTKRAYVNFFIDCVAETFTSGNCFFITEKTVRPMMLKKPFIIFGPRDYLAYLRQMGFRTFADFWDENYDGFSDRDRYLKILSLIDDLAKLDQSTLESMYWSMQYSLDHNYNLLMEKKFQKQIVPYKTDKPSMKC